MESTFRSEGVASLQERSRWTTRLLGKEIGVTSGCILDVSVDEKTLNSSTLAEHPRVRFHYTPTSAVH
jgi:hypothetical protein